MHEWLFRGRKYNRSIRYLSPWPIIIRDDWRMIEFWGERRSNRLRSFDAQVFLEKRRVNECGCLLLLRLNGSLCNVWNIWMSSRRSWRSVRRRLKFIVITIDSDGLMSALCCFHLLRLSDLTDAYQSYAEMYETWLYLLFLSRGEFSVEQRRRNNQLGWNTKELCRRIVSSRKFSHTHFFND